MKKGVLFCTCHSTLSAVLPPDKLASVLDSRYLRHGGRNPEGICGYFAACAGLCCRKEADAAMTSVLNAGVEAVVAAGCALSARGQEALKHLGNRIPVEWVDLRESCAWIHNHLPVEAMDKAVDLLCVPLAAFEQREGLPAWAQPEDVAENDILVVGGGPAGLACAAALGDMGIKAVLAERQTALGGMLKQLGVLFPHFVSGPQLAEELASEARRNGTRILLGTMVAELEAVPAGYRAVLRGKNGEEQSLFKAVILATGAMPVLPHGYCRYGELPGVISQMELETRLRRAERGDKDASDLPGRAVFLQCVAARDDNNPYCSAICCPTAVKNAIRLRTLRPEGNVTIVHRSIVTPGEHLEALYRRAGDAGVFLRSRDPEFILVPVGRERIEGLKFRDALNGEDVLLPADALVCSTPLKPHPTTVKLAESLGLRLDSLGFACGREPIQPLSSFKAGLFVCGAARWPAVAEHSLEQGRAAAVKAAGYLRGFSLRPSGIPFGPAVPKIFRELMPDAVPPAYSAQVEKGKCSRCGRCAAACPYGACFLPEEEESMKILRNRCARCGSCAAVCPTGAAHLPGESMGAVLAGLKEALGGVRP
jgi:heterodisulfide reductase subunit A